MRAGARQRGVAVILLVLALAACGGGSDGRPAPTPPGGDPPDAGSPAVIGGGGGTVQGPGGVTVAVPPDALTEEVTVRVAVDSTGAPSELPPATATAGGAIYAITPHGAEFRQPVEVRLPAPVVTLQANQALAIAKAQPGGRWEVQPTTLQDGQLVTRVSSFSLFTSIVITYPLPLVQREPWAGQLTLSCGGQDCKQAVGPVTFTLSWTDNGGQLPSYCDDQPLGQKLILRGAGVPGEDLPYARTGSVTRTVLFPFHVDVQLWLTCGPHWVWYPVDLAYTIVWSDRSLQYPQVALVQQPARLDVAAGQPATLRAVFVGGGSRFPANGRLMWDVPRANDSTVVDWERSTNDGASWQHVATSYERDAEPRPLGGEYDWRYWAVRHVFTPSAADDGSLLRVRYCYTLASDLEESRRSFLPDPLPPPCTLGPAVRVHVLADVAPPSITVPPNPVLVRSGETATFSAQVSGLPAPDLRWETRPPGSTGAWAGVSAGTGAATATYSTPPLTLEDNGRQYRLVAVNALGTAASAGVTASVSAADVAPAIVTQPTDLTVTQGNDAVFAVLARGTEALSYQWRYNGEPISGANGAVLRLGGVHAGSGGAYSVQVSNAAGTAVSRDAVLTVLPPGTTPTPVAPTILTQPAAVTVSAGNTATFAVGVTGTAPLAFQWRKGSTPIPGATSAAFTLQSVAAGDVGEYSVVVSNSVDSVTSSTATLTLAATPPPTPVAPAFTTQPTSLVQMPGSTATLAVAASGSGPLTYVWTHDGEAVAGASGPVLTLAGVTAAQAGTYQVTVSNAAGSATSDSATLVVVGAPAITAQPGDVTAAAGATATLSVVATGQALRYQWLRDNVAVVGATSAAYTTPVLAAPDSGAVFRVIVYNAAGAVVSGPAVLTVSAPVGFPAGAVPLRATHAELGQELWMTDGTTDGTVLLRDIFPGESNSSPSQFTRLGGWVYFSARDDVAGQELWRTDGTTAGTVRVADVHAGVGSSFPEGLVACNGLLFFGASDASGHNLYRTDGTAAGTLRLGTVRPGSGQQRSACVGGVLYFGGYTPAAGEELWRSDGTEAGTVLVEDLVPGTSEGAPYELTELQGRLFFNAANALWRSDGTPEGTTQVSTAVQDPRWLTAHGSVLYFAGLSGAEGREPWTSDGTPEGTVLLADLVPGSGSFSSYPYKFTPVGGVVYFAAQPSLNGPQQLWRTDGTAAGTVDLTPSLSQVAAFGDSILGVNGTLFFSASSGGTNVELWKSDGTASGTVLVRDIAGTGGSYPSGFFRLGDALYFGATGAEGAELWRSDGTTDGTVLVKDLCSPDCSGSPQPK